jgi:hypothetical protein
VVWAFASRAHAYYREVCFKNEAQNIPPVLLDVSEKFSFRTAKVIHNCLPSDRYAAEERPRQSDLEHGCIAEIRERVLTRWREYGYR